MSTIGPANIGALNLIGSFSGAQRTEADTDRVKENADGRRVQADQKTMSAHSSEDVAEADLSSDRDADGQLPYGHEFATGNGSSAEEDALKQDQRNVDPDGVRGRILDLEV